MSLNPLYILTQDLDSYFVDKDTGLPLAGGILTFYEDAENPTVLQPVYTLADGPPYDPITSYVALPNPIILSSVGTVQDASGNNVPIYYYPYNQQTGDLSLYTVVCTDAGGVVQFTRHGWPNITSANTPTQVQPPSASSFLVGWDFPLNPFQFGASSTLPAGSPYGTPPNGPITSTAGYICDQTIAGAATGNTITWNQNSITNGLNLITDTTGAFYLLQYLSGAQVQKMLGIPLSMNIFGYVFGASAPVTMRIYLFRAPHTASIPSLLSPTGTTIGTILSNGTFQLTAAGWNAIPFNGLPIPNVTLSTVSTPDQINNLENNYGFTGWQITAESDVNDTRLFAVVVTFAYTSNLTNIVINSIALTPGDIPSIPSILTPDDTLLECQYYYQKSFIGNQVPTAALGVGTGESYSNVATQIASAPTRYLGPIIRFPVPTRAIANVTLYSPVNPTNQITVITTSADWTSSIAFNTSNQGFEAIGVTSNFVSCNTVHWACDARLAIV